ncbi:MAG: Nramp family divalent metal transporter [Pirellulaceae bacterium]
MVDDPTRPDDEQPDVTENQSEGAASEATAQATSDFVAPHPGSKKMPRWNTAELIDAPYFTRRNWFAMLGPALVMGGAAIGGGEWLLGPLVTAKYGAALLWLATISVLGQVLYNIEISRYTLYTGEPIFTGKFRTMPGPAFWVCAYLVFDLGSIFPYLAKNAATPVATIIKGGEVPTADDYLLVTVIGYLIFLAALVPLFFGGKIYNSLRIIMSAKIVLVFGFLLTLAFFFSSPSTWVEICSGFVQFGNVPIERAEKTGADGKVLPSDDWDMDGHADGVEPILKDIRTSIKGSEPWPDFNQDGKPDAPVDTDGDGKNDSWGDLTTHNDTNDDGRLDTWSNMSVLFKDENKDGDPDAWPDVNDDKQAEKFIDIDGDGIRDGNNIDNIFLSIFRGDGFPDIDFTLIAFITGLAAIAGSGGLSNTPTSNFTRDQGWGMGHHVGAIPSVIGGHDIKLSHVGSVFEVNAESLPKWRRWYRHVCRDQLVIWMPTCFIGLALPSMLSIQFLRRGTDAGKWNAASMTADGVGEAVAESWGSGLGDAFWFMTLLCGFLVLAPSMASSIDGICRRWVDAFWTASKRLRKLDPKAIRIVYFRVLTGYACFGMVMLLFPPSDLIKYATMIFNLALGFSCWHTVVINTTLLPPELRPGWFIRITLSIAGVFFFILGTMAVLEQTGLLAKIVG